MAWLNPRSLPFMEEVCSRQPGVRRATNITLSPTFAPGFAPFTVPPHTEASLILDQAHLTNAFRRLTVSGGKGARVRVNYAEAMVDAKIRKGNRNDTEDRQVVGI